MRSHSGARRNAPKRAVESSFSESKIWMAIGVGQDFVTRSPKISAGLDCNGMKGRTLVDHARRTSKVNGAKSISRFGENCGTRS
jgi:hypothetical protein